MNKLQQAIDRHQTQSDDEALGIKGVEDHRIECPFCCGKGEDRFGANLCQHCNGLGWVVPRKEAKA